jgi:hypothetical protein
MQVHNQPDGLYSSVFARRFSASSAAKAFRRVVSDKSIMVLES